MHEDVVAGGGHVAAVGSTKGAFGLKASAATAPGPLRVMPAATAGRNARARRRLLRLGTAPAQQKPRKLRCRDHEDTETKTEGCMRDIATRANVLVTMPLETIFWVGILLPPSLCVTI